MAALGTNTSRRVDVNEGWGEHKYEVASNVRIYQGSLVGSSGGKARALVAGDLFLGIAFRNPANNLTGVTNPDTIVDVVPVGLLRGVSVTNATQAMVGSPVFASNDNDLTIVASGNSPIGRLHSYDSTSATWTVSFCSVACLGNT
jgi:hypothetical protein